jgi:hypothetical protein
VVPQWGSGLRPHRPDLRAREEGRTAPGLGIVSPPGGGKAVTVGSFVCRHPTREGPPEVLLVDPAMGDYRRLVRELGARSSPSPPRREW